MVEGITVLVGAGWGAVSFVCGQKCEPMVDCSGLAVQPESIALFLVLYCDGDFLL